MEDSFAANNNKIYFSFLIPIQDPYYTTGNIISAKIFNRMYGELNQCCGSDHFCEYQRHNQISPFSGAKLPCLSGPFNGSDLSIESKEAFFHGIYNVVNKGFMGLVWQIWWPLLAYLNIS